MKTYLATGATDSVGVNFIKHIPAKYDDIKTVVLGLLIYTGSLGIITEGIDGVCREFVKGNICNRALADRLFEKYSFDYIVNFAAESHVDRSIENSQLFLQTNIPGTRNLLGAARKVWVTGKAETGYSVWHEGVRLHQVPTDEVCGSLGAGGYFHETMPLDSRGPYSASKISADLFVKAYHETHKMPVSITRCSNNYRPCHFPEKLIPLVIKSVSEGESLPIYGDGTNVRDWLYAEDRCKAIDVVTHHRRVGEIYGVGGHNEKQNIKIVKLMIRTIHQLMTEQPEYRQVLKRREIGTNGGVSIDRINDNSVIFVKDRLGHDQQYAIDPVKITSGLGWTPKTCLEVDIVKTIRWYLENQKWVEDITGGDYMKYYE